jgi:membrane-bound lytic murein transglycosylase A
VRSPHRILIGLALAAAALAACEREPAAPPAETLTLEPVRVGELPGWNDDRLAEALPAIRSSCAKLAAQPDDTPAGPAGTRLRSADWRPACAAFAALPEDDAAALRAAVERWLKPYRAGNNGSADGLFTGYYEPELHGSRKPGGRFTIPLYGRPDDLVTVDLGEFDESLKGKRIAGEVSGGALKPYATRAEIEGGAVAGKASELLWVNDPVDLFFLQIQGSGRVSLEDGSMVRVGYAAQNGRTYRSIGKVLVDRGELALDGVSLQAIKDWLRAHPSEAKSLMDENASYVFFRELSGDGPNGAEGVPLTPGRSLAIDPKFVSYGVPIWLDIESPKNGERIQRLVVAQDTGGAIKGPVRGDLFWGFGPDAEAMAGPMRSRGDYYLFLPR